MSDGRKATDIILDMESKIDNMSDKINNLEFLIKTLAARLNQPTIAPQAVELIKTMPGLKPGVELNSKDGSKIVGKYHGLKENNISIEQQLQYYDGKALAMAHVEIFKKIDNKLEPIHKLKTNPAGKWMANLSSGEYTINVSKRSAGAKPIVEGSYDVTIPETEGQLKLDAQKIV